MTKKVDLDELYKESKWLEEEVEKYDSINPSHYREHPSGVECIQITEHFNFCLGNAIKYIWRAGLKTADKKEDIKKAIWYLNRELEKL